MLRLVGPVLAPLPGRLAHLLRLSRLWATRARGPSLDPTCRGCAHRLAPLLALLALASPAAAQTAADALPEPAIPNFWDPRAPREPVELPAGRTIRFLTSADFPPLHFLGADGVPTGFVVEIARAACVEAGVACTIQSRPFETLLPTLEAAEGDAVAAAVRVTAELREGFAVTIPFYRFPARLAAPVEAAGSFDVAAVEATRVGVVAGTAHEAYVATFWPGATRVPAETLADAQDALRAGETDLLFADGLALALWVGGRASEGCCTLVSGPFLDSRFFGEGIGFVFRPGDARLAEAFDAALARLWAKGTYAEIYLRFFPVGPF